MLCRFLENHLEDVTRVLEEVQQRSCVKAEAARTGGERREVAVDDVERSSADGDVDAEEFESVVVDVD